MADLSDLKKEVTDAELQSLGLMCGLEIHQQLEGRKLFCRCPTRIRDDDADFTVLRSLRASAGESGEMDAAALAEVKKGRRFLYQGYRETTCLVELDEEPPGPADAAAVLAVMQAAKLFGMRLFPQVRFMRKTVVDGSNTSGFQRTGLCAVDGKLTTEKGVKVRVDTLCLEEDACKKAGSTLDAEVYNLSRLGIPLLEVATAPDMHTAQDVHDVAETIGMILRSLPNVKRGLGTIRQDVNVSIKEGVRVEIKGAQDLRLIPTIVRYEALRQHNMLLIGALLKARGARVGAIADITDVLRSSSSKVIKGALSVPDGVVLAVPLFGFMGVTGAVVQPGRRFGSELADHAKLMGVKGLFHADELPNYGITAEEKQAVFDYLGASSSDDNFLLIADRKEVAWRALRAACERAADLSLRKEVRNALPEGASAFLRPMPGSARMYPETDVKPVVLDDSRVEAPQLLSERIDGLAKTFSLPLEQARRIIKEGIDLDGFASRHPDVKPSFIVDYFLGTPSVAKKEHSLDIVPGDLIPIADEQFDRFGRGDLTKNDLSTTSVLLLKGERVDFSKYLAVSEDAIDDAVKAELAADPAAPLGALMGKVMARLGGKADGKAVMARIKASQKP